MQAACTLQGNLNPAILRRDAGGTEVGVVAAVTELFESIGTQRLIVNLGEGLGGKEDPLLVSVLVDAVHTVSERLIAAGGT